MNNKLPLSLLSMQVAQFAGQQHGPSPRKLHDLVLRGVIPAEMVNGKWFFAPDAVPVAAKALGLNINVAA